MSPINKDNHINIINIAKNALKMKNSDTFYRIRIVLLTWRRIRDLNPSAPFGTYELSKPAPSASWVILHAVKYYTRK